MELVRPVDTGMQWGDEGNVGGEKSSGDKGGWEGNNENRHGGSPDGWAGAGGGGGGVAHVRHVSFGSPRLANGNAARYISTMLNNVQTTSSSSQQKPQPSPQAQSQRELLQSPQQQLQLLSQPPERSQSPSPQSQSSSPPRLPKEQLPTGVSAPVMRLTHYRDIVPHNPFTTLGTNMT